MSSTSSLCQCVELPGAAPCTVLNCWQGSPDPSAALSHLYGSPGQWVPFRTDQLGPTALPRRLLRRQGDGCRPGVPAGRSTRWVRAMQPGGAAKRPFSKTGVNRLPGKLTTLAGVFLGRFCTSGVWPISKPHQLDAPSRFSARGEAGFAAARRL